MVTTGRRAFRTLRVRGLHVVRVQGLEHVRPDHPHVERGEEDRERQPRQDHVVGPLDGPAAARRGVDEVAVAAERHGVEAEAEEVGEHQADPERMGRDPDQDTRHRDPVEEAAGSEGGEDPDRNRDQQPEEGPAEDEPRRHRRRGSEDLRDALAVDEGAPEVAADQVREELRVLGVDRPVDVQLLAHVGGCGLGAADALLLLRRQDEEEDVRDGGDREKEDRRPQDPPDEIGQHLGLYGA
jgi:hypothetical protein